MKRIDVLEDLIRFSKDVSVLEKNLSKFNWDYEREPIIIKGSAVQAVLERYLNGEYTAKDLESWANLIELREDLEFEQEKYEVIEDVIYRLANPDLQEKLTPVLCNQLLTLLKE